MYDHGMNGHGISRQGKQHDTDEYNQADFDAFARSLGGVPTPVPEPQVKPQRGNGANRRSKALPQEYRQMVRDAKAFYGDEVREKLTEMLAPYYVSDTHELTPRQCAEIAEKIEILRSLAEREAA